MDEELQRYLRDVEDHVISAAEQVEVRDAVGNLLADGDSVALIKDLDLLDIREAHFTPRNPDGTPGQPQKLAEYYAVSEDKLRALPAEKLVELRDNGALGQIYAHLVSLLGWDRLIAMALTRAAQQPAAANA